MNKADMLNVELEIRETYLAAGMGADRAKEALAAVSNALLSSGRTLPDIDRESLEFAEETINHILRGLLRIRYSMDEALAFLLEEGEG
ncbi:MAG: hypothetical protein ACWGPR_12265 [Candidatus Deferrimicrobiaceae bacterium]